jgi:hypothetical protein
MVKFRELLPKLFSKESTELVKTGAESAKAVFNLAKLRKIRALWQNYSPIEDRFHPAHTTDSAAR